MSNRPCSPVPGSLGLQHPQCRTILVGRSLCRSLHPVLRGKSLLVLKFSQIWLVFCPFLHFLWFHHPQTVAWAFSSAPSGAVALLEGCRDPKGFLAARGMLCRGGCSAQDDDLAHPWGAVGHHGHLCPSNQCWPSQHDLLFVVTNWTGSVAAGRAPPGLKTSSLSSQPQRRNSELGGDTRAKATARKDPLDQCFKGVFEGFVRAVCLQTPVISAEGTHLG